jgi:hypothetical protein
MSTSQFVKFSEIRHLLPADCNTIRYSIYDNDSDGLILFYDGDTQLESIDLEYHDNVETQYQTILIRGNLTVSNYIYTSETDGSIGLIVLGNLTAKNIITGGQEIYVQGSLVVNELFWGDYNHGDLTVKGDATALFFAETEQYHVNIAGERKFIHYFSNFDEEEDWVDLDEEKAKKYFIPEILWYDDEEDVYKLSANDEVLTILKKGGSVLTNFVLKGEPSPHIEKTIYTHEQLKELVTIEKIRRMLALPMVAEKYYDYYNTDINGYWSGKFKYSFRQLNQQKAQCARIGISKELPTVNQDDEFDCNFYVYDIEKDAAGNEIVVVSFQAHNGYEHTPVEIRSNNEEHIQDAYKRFTHLEKNIYTDNDEYIKQLEDEKNEAVERQNKINNQQSYKTPNLVLTGIAFKVITIKEADKYVSNLTWGPENEKVDAFPSIDADSYFLLAEEEVKVEKLDMEAIVSDCPEDLYPTGIIFLKDVVASIAIFSLETDVSPFAVFMGNVQSKNIAFYGNTHFVQGNISCETLFGYYNHGSLYVNGTVQADLILADDFSMNLNAVISTAVVNYDSLKIKFILTTINEEEIERKVIVPLLATHNPSEVLINAVLSAPEEEDYPHYREALVTHFDKGLSVIDYNKVSKAITQKRSNFLEYFDKAFKHTYFKKEDRWTQDGDTIYYSINHLKEHGLKSISYYSSYHHFLIQALLYNNGETNIAFYLYEKDNDTKIAEFELDYTQQDLLVWGVLNMVEQAITAFNEGV